MHTYIHTYIAYILKFATIVIQCTILTDMQNIKKKYAECTELLKYKYNKYCVYVIVDHPYT